MRSRLPAPSSRALILAGVALPALASAASPQSPAVLGKDDTTFARRLYDRGLADLAEGLCAAIEKKGDLSAEAAVGLRALHLDLRLDLARNEPDPIKRKDVIKGILQEKEDLIQQHPASREAEDTTNSLPDVYRSLGEAITLAIQKESDPALIAELRKEGEQIYTQAEDKFKARIDELAQEHSSPEDDRTYVNLLFNLPRTFYYHSLLYPEGEWKKKDLLEKAVEGFQLFGLDYQETLLNYEGLILMGLADKDLGKNEEALADFDDAIKLADYFEKDGKGLYQLPPEVADTISGAVLQKVLFQTELKDYAGASATARKFFEEIPEPYFTRLGLAVLAAKAEAEVAAGEAQAASESAELLVQKDERGRWGQKGRELQARLLGEGSGSIDPANMLKIAGSVAARGNDTRALEICRQAVAVARGTPKEASVGVDGYILIGNIFLQRGSGWTFEAILAFDTAHELWPAAERAPEAAYQAMLGYYRLNAEDRRPWFKKRGDERLKLLGTRWPTHPRAFYAQIAEGSDLEAEGKFLDAAKLYQQVQPGTASYLEAQYRAGNAYFRQAYALCQEKKAGEAGQYVKQAETLLKKVKDDLDTAIQGTMDLEAQSRYSSTSFQARASLAQLYLMDCVNRPTEVLQVLEGVDERFAEDSAKIGATWAWRISALEKQGKLDEAVALLDTLTKKEPGSRAIGAAAGQIARALDRRAQELLEQGKTRESDAELKRAVAYYAMSGRAMAKSGQVRASDMEPVADRILALAFKFNEIPDKWDSFVGWDPSRARESGLWKDAEELYAATLQLAPSTANMIKLGRVLGFQGRYGEAAVQYGRLFDDEEIILQDTAGGAPKFNQELLRRKGELYLAYLEWGVAALEAAIQDKDAEMFVRADTIFANLVRDPRPEVPIYWHAKYQQIRSLIEQGKYQDAKLVMNDIERKNSELGTPAGLQGHFKALKADLEKKVFSPRPGSRAGSPR